MPAKRATGQRKPSPPPEREEAQATAEQPVPAPVEGKPVDRGRPHQAFVEAEAGKFRQAMETGPDPAKPPRPDSSAAAAPRPARDTQHGDDIMRRRAVAAVAQYAREKGWVKPPYSNPYESPSYVDALIQLADDAGWLAREIPLPAHAEPRHPTIYYTVDAKTGEPVPQEDSLIRADFVYDQGGCRISEDSHIRPWLDPLSSPASTIYVTKGAYYSLKRGPRNGVQITIYWLMKADGFEVLRFCSLDYLHFSPRPPAVAGPGRERQKLFETWSV